MVPDDEDAIDYGCFGLLSVDDVVSFDIASSDLVFIPISLILEPPKTETQPIALSPTI